MFSVMKCLHPTHISVKVANGCHGCSVARNVSPRRRIGGRTMEFVIDHEYFLGLSNRGAFSIFDASFKFARASIRVQEGLSQLCVQRKEQLEESHVVFSVIRNFVGFTSASVGCIGNGLRFRGSSRLSRLVSEDGRVLERRGFKRSFRSIPCTVACASIHRSVCRFGRFRRG